MTKWSDTFRSFLNMERSKDLEKICHNRAKKFIFLRGFDRKNTLFEISRNLIRKASFQMALNEENDEPKLFKDKN